MIAVPYRALGHTFSFDPSGIASVDHYLARAFEALRADGSPDDEIIRLGALGGRRWWCATEREERELDTPELLLRYLMWHVNRRAIDPRRHVVLHGGAVERGGKAALVVGHTNAGKTTLTGALVARGFGYLTDELVTLDVEGAVRPYPKPLVLGRGSQRLLPGFDPGPFTPDDPPLGIWLVPPGRIRHDPLGKPAPVTHVFFVRRGSSWSRVQELTPGEATGAVMDQIIQAGVHGRAALDWAVELAARSSCYRLQVCNLNAACDLVTEAFDRAAVRA